MTQAALSNQIADFTGLGHRDATRRSALPSPAAGGEALTHEGAILASAVRAAMGRISDALDIVISEQMREVVTLGGVSAFATGWLLPRLADFSDRHPEIELRMFTNNNKPELAGEGLNDAIRFGDGAQGTACTRPICWMRP